MSTHAHKKDTPGNLHVSILTVSTTRTQADDKSGQWIQRRIQKEGHQVVFYRVIPDDKTVIRETVVTLIKEKAPHGIILTGGTGISSKDVTIEAVSPLFRKELSAFGPIFAQLSFEDIDSAAILSRATAGVAAKSVIFCIPGSLKACKLACNNLIFPEMGHLVKHVYEG